MNRDHSGGRWVAAALVAVGLGWLAWRTRSALAPFLVALLAAYVLHPIVSGLEKRGLKRTAATILVGTAGLAIGLFAVAYTVEQGASLVQSLTEEETGPLRKAAERVSEWVRDVGSPALAGLMDDGLLESVRQRADDAQVLDVAGRAAGGVLQAVGSFLAALVGGAALLLLFPIYLFLFLLQLDSIWAFLKGLLPQNGREATLRVLERIHQTTAGFFRGRLVVGAVKGAMLGLGMVIIGVPHALFLGLFAGMLAMLPILGPLLGFVLPALLVVFGDGDGIWSSLGLLTALFLAMEGIEALLLVPKFVGREVGLPPLAILFAVTAGGAAFGLFGLVLSIPIAAGVQIVCQEVLLPPLRKAASP